MASRSRDRVRGLHTLLSTDRTGTSAREQYISALRLWLGLSLWGSVWAVGWALDPDPHDARSVVGTWVSVMFMLPLFRFAGYLVRPCDRKGRQPYPVTTGRPPINLVGRLAFGRLVVWGYDFPKVVGLAIFLVGAPMPWLLHSAGIPMEWAYLPAWVIMCAITAFSPPRTEASWLLTGQFSFDLPGARASQDEDLDDE